MDWPYWWRCKYFDGQNFRIFSKTNGFFSSDITAIIEDKEGNTWITSELSGLLKLRDRKYS